MKAESPKAGEGSRVSYRKANEGVRDKSGAFDSPFRSATKHAVTGIAECDPRKCSVGNKWPGSKFTAVNVDVLAATET